MRIKDMEAEFIQLAKESDFEHCIIKMKVRQYNVLSFYLYKRKPLGGVFKNIYYIDEKRDVPIREVRPIKEQFKQMQDAYICKYIDKT